ncbi:MAG: glycoside hydrolase family 27 protein [Kiritimatiellia bacterium]|jgi:alpha-galactosidase
MNDTLLTPPAPATPRINGARIVGARPGSPFLFRIPTTGERPMRFAAAGLPDGLELDAAAGIIRGATTCAGEHRVTLSARNHLGEATSELRIRIGDAICLTPPMGWNSWYCHSELVSEQAIRDTARALVGTGLADHGWTYVNIDDCWQGVRGGPDLAIQPNERFTDMKGLCDDLHALGLKAGIYSTPWMGTYAGFIGGSAPDETGDSSAFHLPETERLQPHQFFGRYPGSIERGLDRVGTWFFDRDARQWAEWGFDYVKVDWNPNDVPTTRRIHDDLRRCPRDIVLSLSNRAPFENAEGLARYANCWRTTGDINDSWESISKIGFAQLPWQRFQRPGHWNDPDMLQVGRIGTPNRKNTQFNPTRLTRDEQVTQMSLWCLLSAPLLLSCDIASLDAFTLSLLTNDEVIAINQDPAAQPARQFVPDDTAQIWTKRLEDGATALGLFNLGDAPRDVTAEWAALGLDAPRAVRDLWRQQDLGAFPDAFTARVPAHGVVLVKTKG